MGEVIIVSNQNSVGIRIRIARTAAKLKQDDVAQKLGISKSNISEWETGKRSPGIDQMEDIAAALGTTSSYLLGFESHSVPESDLSPEALAFARDFDRLDEEHKRLARGFMALLKDHMH
jgi:transcriptional regulator with XRE-family HTH domain